MKSRSFWSLLGEENPTAGLLRSVAVLASGSVLAQCIIILASPLLTRLYSPTEFGVFATYGAAFVVLSALNAASYHVAIPVAADHGEAIDIGLLSLIGRFAWWYLPSPFYSAFKLIQLEKVHLAELIGIWLEGRCRHVADDQPLQRRQVLRFDSTLVERILTGAVVT